MSQDAITGKRFGNVWCIRVRVGDHTDLYEGESLLALVREIGADLCDDLGGVARRHDPDAHDISGESRHIGQPFLKRERPVPHNGVSTSIEAAESIRPHRKRLKTMVLDFIRNRGTIGATDWEIEQHLQLSHQTASARRNELVKDGGVYRSHEKRKTGSGRNAIVWKAAPTCGQSTLF
jgi:hypothetical protein